jgi:hypothetical protein
MDYNILVYSQYIYMRQKPKVNPIFVIGQFPWSLEIYQNINAYKFLHITNLLFL